jgi:hypothetical protein
MPQEVVASLDAWLAKQPPPRRPIHPQTGCPCIDCTTRDDRLEDIAETRKYDQ